MAKNIYSLGSDIITITNEDCTGRKLAKARTSVGDEDSVAKLFQSIIDKYGLELKVIKSKRENPWLEADEEFKW